MEVMPRDSSEAFDRQSEIELSIRLLAEAVTGGALETIKDCTQIAEATRERVNGFVNAGGLGEGDRALLDEALTRLGLALDAISHGKRTRSAQGE